MWLILGSNSSWTKYAHCLPGRASCSAQILLSRPPISLRIATPSRPGSAKGARSSRLRAAWAVQLMRHQLLDRHVEIVSGRNFGGRGIARRDDLAADFHHRLEV